MSGPRYRESSMKTRLKDLTIHTQDQSDEQLYIDRNFLGASSLNSTISSISNFSNEIQPAFGLSPTHIENVNTRLSWSSNDSMSSSNLSTTLSAKMTRGGKLTPLDPIEISPSFNKARSTSIQTAAQSSVTSSMKSDYLTPRDIDVNKSLNMDVLTTWNNMNKSSEIIPPSSPTSSACTDTSSTQSRISSFFGLPYKQLSSSSSDSRSSLGSPNNRLPPMSKSISMNMFQGRKAISEPARMMTPQQMQQHMQNQQKSQRQSPTLKSRPNISERMSSLISIFSRSDTVDLSSTEPIVPLSSARRASSTSRATKPNVIAETSNAMSAEFMVRNLDTGQVIDLDSLRSDVPSTIPPELLLMKKTGGSRPGSSTSGSVRSQSVSSRKKHSKKSDYPPALPPLYKDMPGNTATKGYVVRTL